jgi:acyl carrier protein
LTQNSAEDLAKYYRDVQSVLDETLSLGPRAYQLKPSSALLGALPELDSQAVLNVLMGIEERFGIAIADDEVDAEVFATLESLTKLVMRKTAGR